MGDRIHSLRAFLAELRRRKVVRVAVVYGIVGFAVIEAADIMIPALSLPSEFVTVVVVAALLGYPIAIVLAWSYDVVPDAITKQADAARRLDGSADDSARPSSTVFRVVVSLGVLAVAILAWLQYQASLPVEPAPPRYADSVAVMPFDNLTGDARYDHVGLGITEEISTHLARILPLKVTSRHSVQAIGERNLTAPQIGNALDVRHVIEGSVRIGEGGRLLATVQHIDAENDAHVWGENFLAESQVIVDFQSDVARQVANRILLMIPGLPRPSFDIRVNLGPGQEAYLEGQRWLGQRTAEGMRRAIENFSRAIELDREFAPAYADLSSAFALALFYRYQVGIDEYAMAAMALAMAEKSLRLDPNLAAGYAARGYLGALIGGSASDVAADFDQAAMMHPNAANIPSWRARSLAQNGNIDEAVSEARRAIALDPYSPARQIAFAELSLQIGRYEEAVSSARMATTLEPRQYRSHAIEARALLLANRPQECANLPLGPHRVLKATCLYAIGNEAESRAIVDEVLEDIRNGSLSQFERDYSLVVTYEDLAVDYAWRGDAAGALQWVALAYERSPVGIEIRILESALFDTVRDSSEFDEAMRQTRAGIYERVSRESERYLQDGQEAPL